MTSCPLLRRGTGISRSVSLVLFALAAPLFLSPTVHAGETVVFQTSPPEDAATKSGFDKRAAVRVEPSDGKAFRLNLRDLPAHRFLKIQADVEIALTPGMDLGFMMMADGRKMDPATMPRNRLEIAVDGGKPAVNASFGGSLGFGGSFPDFEGHFLHLPGTGSEHGPVKVNADDPEVMMGFMGGGDPEKMGKMARHRVAFVIPHTAPDAAVEFAWKLPVAGAGGMAEIMGFGGTLVSPYSITGLTATVIDAPVELGEAQFTEHFKALGGSDPTMALDALNDLVTAGSGILPKLRAQLGKKADPNLAKKFADAVESMDDPSFQKRAAAAKALQDLGSEIIPLARKALAEKGDTLSVETKSTLQNIADRLEKGSMANSEATLTNRIHRLLDTIGGEKAQALKAELPKPKIIVDPGIEVIRNSMLKVIGGVEFGIPVDPFGPAPGLEGDDAPFPPAPPVEPPADPFAP